MSCLNSPYRARISSCPSVFSRSSENCSTAKLASTPPSTIARRITSGSSRPVRARYPMNPPAKLSPAPVGSKRAASGYADAAKTWSPEKKSAPYSPRFTTSARGPYVRMRRAALTTLCSSASWRASASLTNSMSTRRSVFSRLSRFDAIQKFIVSIATKRGAFTWSSTWRCRSGSMLPRNTYFESA